MRPVNLRLLVMALMMSLFPLATFASDRLVPNKPSHSHSPLPCGKCHLRTQPELQPKLKRVANIVYLDECGTCHLAYQPGWLPKSAWKKVMAGLEDHFGEELELSKGHTRTINRVLKKNAADSTKAARSKMVMKSLKDGEAPIRIMDVPYVKQFHEKIPAATIAQKNVRSLANCEACHISAHGGLYIKSHVQIPQP